MTLAAGAVSATFLPGLGMLGVSLTHGGAEHLSLHGGVDAFRAGHTTGMPLLHPWANRLGRFRYRAGAMLVEVPRERVHLEENGLPIHGAMVGERHWEVVAVEDDDAPRLVSRFSYDERALLDVFPFPHEIEIEALVSSAGLRVSTTVRPTGRRKVPVAFGWHPYFRLPGVARRDLVVHLPARHRLELDDRSLPTGEERRLAAEAEPLGSRVFDDGYRLGRTRELGLSGGGRALTLKLDSNYPYAQVFAPKGKRYVALEPMTAPTNALVTGAHPSVAPGDEFTATFSVALSR